MHSSPLFRSVNTQTHGVRHQIGGDLRTSRIAGQPSEEDATRTRMNGKTRRGRDYTPLFRFLLSRVGQPWDRVFAEVKPRLDTTDPVFWLVARSSNVARDFVLVGESSYFSGMFINPEGILQLARPELTAEDMVPTCTCCTHTFNGVRFGNKIKPVVTAPGEA
jgi:hypothetical protein